MVQDLKHTHEFGLLQCGSLRHEQFPGKPLLMLNERGWPERRQLQA